MKKEITHLDIYDQFYTDHKQEISRVFTKIRTSLTFDTPERMKIGLLYLILRGVYMGVVVLLSMARDLNKISHKLCQEKDIVVKD